MVISRRNFLSLSAKAIPLVVLGASAAHAAGCYDAATLPLSQKNRRRSLGYLEEAADPARRCRGCAFFTGTAEGCGTCQMLNGPVNAGASCSSFAARPA